VAIHALYKWFPNELRTLPTAVFAQGASIGVVLAIPILNYVIERFSWHWAFGLLGIAGLVWVGAWILWGQEGGIAAEIVDDCGRVVERVPYTRLLLNGTILSGFAAGFGAYWGLSLLVGWFTPYLITGLGYSQTDASWITTLPWLAAPFICPSAGFRNIFSPRRPPGWLAVCWAAGALRLTRCASPSWKACRAIVSRLQ
jgi:predicted MFS family arabinose efflux permease